MGCYRSLGLGLNRIADFLQTEKGVDGRRLMVFGHSRLGKTALWAAASDARWALVVSNESGEGGAALSKRDFGETVAIINAKFPWWFSPVYKSYGSNVAAMPVDQPMLLGLMAPRPLYVASAAEDLNSDPKGEFLGAQGAGVVYGLYGKRGLAAGICRGWSIRWGMWSGIISAAGSIIFYYMTGSSIWILRIVW
ncbi:hypothetical protein ACQ86N_35135 [Puia sp. P3]|uniref:glucuronyl esterase domain-containing protein n=1 Tax=Puia sp. P3 TaxID=3423952 RepID=UPI003D6657AE